jgi:hypothetical protein
MLFSWLLFWLLNSRLRPGLLFFLTIPVAQWPGAGLLCQIPDNKIQDNQGCHKERS